MLGIADETGGPLVSAPWIGAFVSLGSRLRRYATQLDGRQLVVAISVPRRDYVAALVGSGWMLSSPAPQLAEPIDVFRAADRTTYLRAVTDRLIITGAFSSLEESRNDPRVLTGGKLLPVARYQAVAQLDGVVDRAVGNVPNPGYLAELMGASKDWAARLAAPSADMALVGTAKWLHEDLNAVIGDGAADGGQGTPMSAYVLPDDDRAATWSTPVVPAYRIGEGWELPETCLMAVLDRFGAIKLLNDITTPLVLCIVDRSVADESAAETIIEARHNNSRPVSIVDELRWRPPRTVEALAFTVAV
ncbi:hypothetical protein HOQ23_00395 [Nocardioides sp. zg-DK7169]|nr:hypothetical protein [Nocardioides sp. zg-DK7169]